MPKGGKLTIEINNCAIDEKYARDYALNNLRNQVGANGATHVVVTDETQLMQGIFPVGGNSLTLTGLGYKCPACK